MKVFLLLFTSFLCFSQESSLQDFAQALKEQDIDRIMTYVGDEIEFVGPDMGGNPYPDIFPEGYCNKKDVEIFFSGAWEESLFDFESINFWEDPEENRYMIQTMTSDYFFFFDFTFKKTGNKLKLYRVDCWCPGG
jgi:hypothetical protein